MTLSGTADTAGLRGPDRTAAAATRRAEAARRPTGAGRGGVLKWSHETLIMEKNGKRIGRRAERLGETHVADALVEAVRGKANWFNTLRWRGHLNE
jgi:hypothetical protein